MYAAMRSRATRPCRASSSPAGSSARARRAKAVALPGASANAIVRVSMIATSAFTAGSVSAS